MTRPSGASRGSRRSRAAAMLAAGAFAAAAFAAAAFAAGACASCARRSADAGTGEDDSLVVFSSHPADLARPVVAEFRDRTGIAVRVVHGGTSELLLRLRAAAEAAHEAAQGAAPLPAPLAAAVEAGRCDLMWGGGAETLTANADLFEPYVSVEDASIPEAYKAPDRAWTGFTVLPMVIGYNTRLLDRDAVPRTWEELLEPRFAGAIAYADPAVSASSYTILRTFGYAVTGAGGARDHAEAEALFVRALGGKLLGQSADVFPSVASGEYLVGLFHDEAALQLISAGSDLGIVYPADGTSAVPDGVALARGARKPAEAKAFIDFVLGRDVGLVMATRFLRRSARGDCPPPEGQPPVSSLALVPYDIAESAAAKRATLVRFASYRSSSP